MSRNKNSDVKMYFHINKCMTIANLNMEIKYNV